MIPLHEGQHVSFNPQDEYSIHPQNNSEAKKVMVNYKIIIPRLNDFTLRRFTSKEEAFQAYREILAHKNRGFMKKAPAPISDEQAAFAFDFYLGIVCQHIVKLPSWLETLYKYEDTPVGKRVRFTLFHKSFDYMPMWMVEECETRSPYLRPMLQDCLGGINKRRMAQGLPPMAMMVKNVENVPSASYIFLPEKPEGT